MNLRSYIEAFRRQRKPLRFLAATVLVKSGLCRFFEINRNGYKLKFSPSHISVSLWIDKTDRQEGEEFVSNYLTTGDKFIDVGANIGTYSLAASDAVGPSGKVISFEPHPTIFSFLVDNIALNGFSNIEAHNSALGDVSGYISLTDARSDDENAVTTSDGIRVKLDTLDDLALGNVSLLKIDVEGYEKFVLRGAEKTLSITNCVYFECWDQHFRKYGYSASVVFDILSSCGFSIFEKSGDYFRACAPNSCVDECKDLIAIREGHIGEFMQRTGLKLLGV